MKLVRKDGAFSCILCAWPEGQDSAPAGVWRRELVRKGLGGGPYMVITQRQLLVGKFSLVGFGLQDAVVVKGTMESRWGR